MGQKTILTPIQRRFLALVLKNSYLLKNYYLTGGTVLSEFYLKHRFSHDIDLFNEKEEIHLPSVSKFVSLAGGILGAKKISHSRFLGLHTFEFLIKNKTLKVDFNYYPFERIDKRKNWHGLAIDSFLDIAVNKIHTVSMKPRARDFVDLYFIFQDKKLDTSLKNLIILAKTKFDWHIDSLQLGENLAKVVTFKDMPSMIKSLTRKQMEVFFLSLAKSLEGEIFR